MKVWLKDGTYWQYFSGEIYFQYQGPFDPTELIKFRQRIDESGAEKILKLTAQLS